MTDAMQGLLQHRREIGIRIAIGSPRASIMRLVTLDSFLMIALGGCAGLVLGLGAARYVHVALLPGESDRPGHDRGAGLRHSPRCPSPRIFFSGRRDLQLLSFHSARKPHNVIVRVLQSALQRKRSPSIRPRST
jgi:ABC-type antimicrobial peptide transport system permease subunit